MNPTCVKNTANEDLYDTELNVAIELKGSRRYAEALCKVDWLLNNASGRLVDSKIWASLFNAPSWFSYADENEDYFYYATSILEKVVVCCEEMDQSSSHEFALAFILGVHFRHTVHNDLDVERMMRLREKLFRIIVRMTGVPQEYEIPENDQKNRPVKMGVMFKTLNYDPEVTSAIPFLLRLREENISLTVFVENLVGDARCVDKISSLADKIVEIPKSIQQAVTLVRQFEFDVVLFANDVTAKPSLFAFLSFFRLARKTCTYVTTIATTQSPYVDHYLGCEYYTKRGFDSEFSEKFLELPDPGYAFWRGDQGKESDSALGDVRELHGIPHGAKVILSAANFTKLHAELIESWCEILTCVPDAYLLLRPFPPHYGPVNESVIERLLGDFERNGVSRDRVKLSLPVKSRADLIEIMRQSDVALDSFPYSGLTTVVDAIEACVPVVCLEGSRLRNCHGACTLHSAGLEKLIAKTKKEYVELTVEIINDDQMKLELRNALRNADTPFLDLNEFSRSSARIFRSIGL